MIVRINLKSNAKERVSLEGFTILSLSIDIYFVYGINF